MTESPQLRKESLTTDFHCARDLAEISPRSRPRDVPRRDIPPRYITEMYRRDISPRSRRDRGPERPCHPITAPSGTYWSGRFDLNDAQLPAFFTADARSALLDCGKYLHVVRECGASPENPKAISAPLVFTTDSRVLQSEISAARDWASKQVGHCARDRAEIAPRSRRDRAEIAPRSRDWASNHVGHRTASANISS